jgi:hypothetical protein
VRNQANKTANGCSSMDTFGGSERVCEQICRPLQFYGHFWAFTVFATKTANACSFMDSFGLIKISVFTLLH